MPCISKDALARPAGLRRERYELPAYGPEAYVVIQALGSRDLLALQERMGAGKQETSNLDFVFELLAKCLCTDDGAPIFASAEEVRSGINVGLDVLQALGEEACRVSGLLVERDEGDDPN